MPPQDDGFVDRNQERKTFFTPSQVHELRVNDQDQTWRLIYRIDSDAIVAVELFSKKTPETPLAVIERSRKRLKTYDADKKASGV